MEQDWQKREAIKAAKDKCNQAIALLREAHSIFNECNQDVRKGNVSEAIEYLEEAAE